MLWEKILAKNWCGSKFLKLKENKKERWKILFYMLDCVMLQTYNNETVEK